MTIITEYLKCIFIEVKNWTMTQYKKTILGIVYRSPSTNIATFTEHVINIIEKLKVENKQCYIMGHMETQDYIDAMFQHSFIPLINKPTRTTTTTATVIDNIYSNDVLGTNYLLHGIIYSDISDHLPIFLY